jgi:hypothetical protein
MAGQARTSADAVRCPACVRFLAVVQRYRSPRPRFDRHSLRFRSSVFGDPEYETVGLTGWFVELYGSLVTGVKQVTQSIRTEGRPASNAWILGEVADRKGHGDDARPVRCNERTNETVAR